MEAFDGGHIQLQRMKNICGPNSRMEIKNTQDLTSTKQQQERLWVLMRFSNICINCIHIKLDFAE